MRQEEKQEGENKVKKNLGLMVRTINKGVACLGEILLKFSSNSRSGTMRIINIGMDSYDLNKVRPCSCGTGGLYQIESQDTVVLHGGQIMYFNMTQDQYECWWCGKVFKNGTSVERLGGIEDGFKD